MFADFPSLFFFLAPSRIATFCAALDEGAWGKIIIAR
jgi:hypothetical protein